MGAIFDYSSAVKDELAALSTSLFW